MTEDYSVPELNRMLEYCEKVSPPRGKQTVLVQGSKLAV